MQRLRDRAFVVASAPLALACILSCGDDDGGGGFSSGLPADKVLAELTEEEAMQACENFADSLDDVVTPDASARSACTGEAVGDHISANDQGDLELDVAGCNEDVEACMAQAGDEFDDEADIECESENITRDLEGCQATVAEFESCISAVTASLRRWLGTLTCDALGRPGALEEFAEMQESGGDIDPFDVPQCNDLSDECPGLDLFETDSSSQTVSTGPGGCSDSCTTARDNECDDGGPGSLFSICPLGTDCADCGER